MLVSNICMVWFRVYLGLTDGLFSVYLGLVWGLFSVGLGLFSVGLGSI